MLIFVNLLSFSASLVTKSLISIFFHEYLTKPKTVNTFKGETQVEKNKLHGDPSLKLHSPKSKLALVENTQLQNKET